MDKLTLAHDYFMKHGDDKTPILSVELAWDYADLMYAEQEKRTDKSRPAVLDDFQVDWGQAPKDAFFWSMDANRACHWFATKPRIIEVFTGEWIGGGYPVDIKAPSFNYQGDWKDSLQGRK